MQLNLRLFFRVYSRSLSRSSLPCLNTPRRMQQGPPRVLGSKGCRRSDRIFISLAVLFRNKRFSTTNGDFTLVEYSLFENYLQINHVTNNLAERDLYPIILRQNHVRPETILCRRISFNREKFEINVKIQNCEINYPITPI